MWVVCRALVVIAAVAVTSHAMDDEMAELARMVRESCAAETGVDIGLVEAVNAGGDLADSPDDKLKCYIKCTMETAGMMSEGVVELETVLALLPDELRARSEAGLRHCATRPGRDHCDVAYNTQLCWQQANRADYFLI